MGEKFSDGILKLIQNQPTGDTNHYISHQVVINESAKTPKMTPKMRIMFDCSAKSDKVKPSSNDCLEIGPSLQPLIFDIILKNRLNKYCILKHIKKAFHQLSIYPLDRDVKRLMWYNNLPDMKIVHLRFTRVIFGSGLSPYILGAALEKHLGKYEKDYNRTTKGLLENTCVDDIQSESNQEENLYKLKKEATKIMAEESFQLNIWHSNILIYKRKIKGKALTSMIQLMQN